VTFDSAVGGVQCREGGLIAVKGKNVTISGGRPLGTARGKKERRLVLGPSEWKEKGEAGFQS